MATVVDFIKWRRWRELKKFVDSGKILLPPEPPPVPPRPRSDAALALAYALAVWKLNQTR